MLSQAALQVPCRMIRPGGGGLYKVRDPAMGIGEAPHGCPSHLTPHPPTLLIQDLRLHAALRLFTASHSRRWPAGRKGTVLLRCSHPHGGCCPSWASLVSLGGGVRYHTLPGTMPPKKCTIPTTGGCHEPDGPCNPLLGSAY